MAALILSEGKPAAIAHRGAPDFAPENTVSSFVTAAEQGADAIECDIWRSLDGKLIVNHDSSTGRVWSEDLVIEETDSKKLLSLNLGYGFRAAFNKYRNEHIPLFSEVLENTGDIPIFAELKSESPEALNDLFYELEKHNAKDRVTVLSFNRDTVSFFLSKGYPSAWLIICDKSEVEELDIPDGAIADICSSALTEDNVRALHERGITVYAFTAKNEYDFDKLSSLGVDGVTCDNLSFIKSRQS